MLLAFYIANIAIKLFSAYEHKLSGVESRDESLQGDWFVWEQMPENDIKDTKIMFLGQLGDNLWSKMEIWEPCNTGCGNPVGLTVSKLLPFDFPCPKT